MLDSTSPVVKAVAGALCIASSAVLMRLAGSSAVAASLFRCLFALPLLGGLVFLERRRGVEQLGRQSRWLARGSGVFFAGDLVAWSHTISAVGAGMATVLANMQVVLVALFAWRVFGERPSRRFAYAVPAMICGVVLTAGAFGAGPGTSRPLQGALFGLASSVFYSAFLLMIREARSPKTLSVPEMPAVKSGAAQVLFEATFGATVASVVLAVALPGSSIGRPWPALGWLAVLAVSSQVVGWLLITVSMPLLKASVLGAILLVQPVGSVVLAAVVLAERPSVPQIIGIFAILFAIRFAAADSLPTKNVPVSPAPR